MPKFYAIHPVNGQHIEVEDEYNEAGVNTAMEGVRSKGYKIKLPFMDKQSGKEVSVSEEDLNSPEFTAQTKSGRFVPASSYEQYNKDYPVKAEIERQAKGGDESTLRTAARMRGVAPEDEGLFSKGASSVLGAANAATANAIPFAYKKFQDDETEQAIDQVNARVEESKPGLQKAGEMAVSAALPIPGAASGKLAAQVGKNVGLGAASGLAESKSGEELSGALTGGTIGGTLGGAMAGVAKIPQAAGAVREFAGNQAVRAINPNVSQIKKLDKVARGEISDLGNEMVDRGMVKMFDKGEQIAERAGAARREVGAKLGEQMAKIGDEAGGVYPRKMYQEYEKFLADNYGVDPELRNQMLGQMKKYIDQYAVRNKSGSIIAYKNIPFNEALKHRQQLDDILSQTYNKAAAPSPQDLARMQRRSVMDRNLMESVDEAAGKTGINAQEIGNLKRDYQINKNIEEIGDTQALKELSRRAVSPSDYGMGAVGALMTSNPIIGAGTAVANNIMRTRMNSTNAVMARQLERALKSPKAGKFAKILNEAASRGNAALIATHGMLLKTNPEYQAIVGDEQ